MQNKGFTLIETILLVLVMGVAIPVLLSVVSAMTRLQMGPMATSVASYLAQEEMEATVARKRSTCASCGYTEIPVGVGAFRDVNGFPNYERKTDVAWVDTSMVSSEVDLGYKKVTVTVRGNRIGLTVPEVAVVTVLSNY